LTPRNLCWTLPLGAGISPFISLQPSCPRIAKKVPQAQVRIITNSLRWNPLCSLTIGPVVWKVTPLFAEWIASHNVLAQHGILAQDSIVLELGCGVSGIVALALAPHVKKYVATDQDYVLKLLRQNVANNLLKNPRSTSRRIKQTNSKHERLSTSRSNENTSNIEFLVLDWELDSVSTLPSFLGQNQGNSSESYLYGVDVLVACDCIYNDALIEPFVTTCAQICGLRTASSKHKPTVCIVAQQLRSAEVFESWLMAFHRYFHVWRVPDELLADSLKENSGFVVHIGFLRS
jgi:predicted nicotinamide N-methyase